MGKFEHGFGTQLGAVLPKQQLQETEKEIFSRNSEGTLGSFCG